MQKILLAFLAFTMAVCIAHADTEDRPFSVGAEGKTLLFFDESHGNQIEYLDAQGRTHLWYPRNRVAVPGQWLMDHGDICFRYGKNTFNPVTRQRGDDWNCSPIDRWQSRIVDTQAGDVFGLAQGSVPYPLAAKPKLATLRQAVPPSN